MTICAQHQKCLFGEIVNGEMRLNMAGQMIERWYAETENKFPNIQGDAFVCMPNHIHFIVVNTGSDVAASVGVDLCVRPSFNKIPNQGGHAGPPLQRIVQWFKTMSTNEYIRGVREKGWPPFSGKLWQRNYWEHVIRNESDLNLLRDYIQNNPMQWELDKLHPANAGAVPICSAR